MPSLGWERSLLVGQRMAASSAEHRLSLQNFARCTNGGNDEPRLSIVSESEWQVWAVRVDRHGGRKSDLRCRYEEFPGKLSLQTFIDLGARS